MIISSLHRLAPIVKVDQGRRTLTLVIAQCIRTSTSKSRTASRSVTSAAIMASFCHFLPLARVSRQSAIDTRRMGSLFFGDISLSIISSNHRRLTRSEAVLLKVMCA
ncbi:hypothetical protein J6590_056984 [Homalodisca vitripennis]|nr:hypothetical protein J6590_056984 [Homalodisca vitripennis]